MEHRFVLNCNVLGRTLPTVLLLYIEQITLPSPIYEQFQFQYSIWQFDNDIFYLVHHPIPLAKRRIQKKLISTYAKQIDFLYGVSVYNLVLMGWQVLHIVPLNDVREQFAFLLFQH